ncbi:uncharacterized protein LOC119669421 [Teleopsis dalmanni]|uniref:uncharacterized protein LOC119669421 n=1 Tax=Teleopsis dalmanni TaxID=139649 RepID=UPI0018CF7471|nr:uncharacterized protein LOC119669421 [Teleopsis dalmanni]
MYLIPITLIIFCNYILFTATCFIYATISLEGKKTINNSYLLINFGPECIQKPDWVDVLSEDPFVTKNMPIMHITDIQNNTSFVKGPVLGKLLFPPGWNKYDNVAPKMYSKGFCLPYYIASYAGNELHTVNCLRIEPNWMSRVPGIAELPLKDLFIPGTHASGAYLQNPINDIKLPVTDYIITQYFDVWSQLLFGIRYLDLSIGYKVLEKTNSSISEEFWIVNENMYVRPLRDVLNDVRKFVKLSGEVVILDFSSFPIGFFGYNQRHIKLLEMISNEIGDIIYNREDVNIPCYNLTINDIKKTKKYLLVIYPLEELPHPENEINMYCPSWKRFSIGFMNNSQALDYMRFLFSKKKDSPIQNEGWIFQGVTSMEQSLNTDVLQTPKERAKTLNTDITNWLSGPWGLNANIVTMDYVSYTNLIHIAIYANIQRAYMVQYKDYVQLVMDDRNVTEKF